MAKEKPLVEHLQNYQDISPIDHGMKAEHVKMAVGAALGGLFGLTLNEWIGVATLLYALMQIGLLIPKYVDLFKRIARKWKNRASNDR